MKPYYRGVLSGIFISTVIVSLYVNGLFGEPRAYTATYLRLENNNPSVFIPTLDTRVDFTHGDPASGSETLSPLSLYTTQTLLDVTEADVEQVCIVRAILDYDGTENWLVRIRLKDTSIFDDTAGSLGFARWGNAPYDPSSMRLGRYTERSSTNDVTQLPDHKAYDTYVSFNEKDVPSTSVLLLQLSPEKGVQPCRTDMEMTQYTRWKNQWNNSPNAPVHLPDDYQY